MTTTTTAVPEAEANRYIEEMPAKTAKAIAKEEKRLAELADRLVASQAAAEGARAALVQAKLDGTEGKRQQGLARKAAEADADLIASETAHRYQTEHVADLRQAFIERAQREELAAIDTNLERLRAEYAVGYTRLEKAATELDDAMAALELLRNRETALVARRLRAEGIEGEARMQARGQYQRLPGRGGIGVGPGKNPHRDLWHKGVDAFLAFHRPRGF